MCKLFCIITLLVANILYVGCEIDMNGLEMTERSQISKFRNWHDYVQYDESLMKTAKQEAQRLLQIGRLEKPQFKLKRNYAGHSKKITGKSIDQITGIKWDGQKMCFDSIFPNDNRIYNDVNYICDNLNLIFEKFYAVGFGIAIDYENDVAYVVRLFLTNQASADSTKQELTGTTSAYNQWGGNNLWSSSTNFNQWPTTTKWMPATTQWNQWSTTTRWNQWPTTTQWMPATTQWNQWSTTQSSMNSRLEKLKAYLNGKSFRSIFNLNKKF